MGIESLLGLVIVPSVAGLKSFKAFKWMDKVPVVTLLLVGGLALGLTELYSAIWLGTWGLTPELLQMSADTAIVAVVGKSLLKTKQKIKE